MHAEKSLLREYLEALLIAVIFATFARTWVVQAFKIPSGSMEKNLLIGDHILVNKFVYGPTLSPLEEKLLPMRKVRRGDIVVFKYPEDPNRDFIKRCMGLPGDTMKMIDKDLYINGRHVDDSVVHLLRRLRELSRATSSSTPKRVRDNFGPKTVAARHLLLHGRQPRQLQRLPLLGDGARELRQGAGLHGLLVLRQRRRDERGGDGRATAASCGRSAGVALNFFSLTRWDRTFRIVR